MTQKFFFLFHTFEKNLAKIIIRPLGLCSSWPPFPIPPKKFSNYSNKNLEFARDPVYTTYWKYSSYSFHYFCCLKRVFFCNKACLSFLFGLHFQVVHSSQSLFVSISFLGSLSPEGMYSSVKIPLIASIISALWKEVSFQKCHFAKIYP